jgi:hypothetical protein
MPSGVVPISRRRVLLGAAALAALGATASACGGGLPTPPEPDRLESQLELARRDSAMARAAASGAGPFYAPMLNVVADERAQHAQALSDEIARAAGPSASSTTSAPSTPSTTAPSPSRNDVIAALRESADSAAKLAANLSGLRAGLLGSISASCTAAATVPLTLKEPTA